MSQIEPLWHLEKRVFLTSSRGKDKRFRCPVDRVHSRTVPIQKEFVHKRFEFFSFFEPSKLCKQGISFQQLKKFYEIETRAFEESLRESNLKLCSNLRLMVGLKSKFEADANALADLAGFMSDLANEKTDASEVVKASRRQL